VLYSVCAAVCVLQCACCSYVAACCSYVADAVEHTAKLRGLGLAIVLLKDAEEPRDPVEQPENRVINSVDQDEDGHVPVVADPHDGSGAVPHEAPWTDALRTNGDGDPAIVDSANGNAV